MKEGAAHGGPYNEHETRLVHKKVIVINLLIEYKIDVRPLKYY